MKGCLLLHGFTGSPDEVRPLASHLQHETDWLIHTPTLPGHGSAESLTDVDWEDWQTFAERACEAFLQRCAALSVIGFSMGGLLAAHLAARYPIERLVLLSAPVFYPHPRQMLEDAKTIVSEKPDQHPALYQDWRRYRHKIKTTPLRAVFQFRKLVKHLRPRLPLIDVPVLIVQGKKDNVVKPSSAEYIYRQVQSEEKNILYLNDSKHLVCHGPDRQALFAAVEKFLCHTRVSL